jgi:hypothetical protein
MRIISHTLLLICVFVITSMQAWSQTGSVEENHDVNAGHGRSGHRITLVMANSIINNSFSDQSNEILIVPTFGFNYDYFLNSKWGLGLHTDILLQQFKVEKHGSHEEIIRENPIALVGMLLFKPHHRWTLMAGYGLEIEKHDNIQMIRTGIEYGIELPKHWELGFSLEYDYKIKTYSSLMFGVTFSKFLGSKA